MRVDIRDAKREDAVFIGKNLRDSDRKEVESLGLRPEDAVVLSYADSDICHVGTVDGVPALIFGCGGSVLGDSASVWALGTDLCDRAPKMMVKAGRNAVKEFLKVYPVLENYCDARYEKSHRWLRKLGFTVGEPEEYGPKKALFCKLTIGRGT